MIILLSFAAEVIAYRSLEERRDFLKFQLSISGHVAPEYREENRVHGCAKSATSFLHFEDIIHMAVQVARIASSDRQDEFVEINRSIAIRIEHGKGVTRIDIRQEKCSTLRSLSTRRGCCFYRLDLSLVHRIERSLSYPYDPMENL
jgi:hypothetical protein